MSATTPPELELLRAKLSLAIGPIEMNLVYDEIKAARPNALDEPWSNDMSGPHKYVVFNNKTFVLEEVANGQLAFAMAHGSPPIDAGENIKLYLNDVWQQDVFRMFGFNMADIRDPVTGGDPLGSLYYSLITSVDECILKKNLGQNGHLENGNVGAGDVAMDEKEDEAKKEDGVEEGAVGVNGNGVGQEEQDGNEGEQGSKDGVMTIEEENHGHADEEIIAEDANHGHGVEGISLSEANHGQG